MISNKRKAVDDGKDDNKPARQKGWWSPAQRLYTDALHSIFKFLPLKQLLPAISVCRSWATAAYKERGRSLDVVLPPSRWPELCASPLGYHIGGISAEETCRPEDVGPLALLPSLVSLSINLDITPWCPLYRKTTNEDITTAAKHIAAHWPLTLRRIKVAIRGDEHEETAWFAQMMIELVSHLPALSQVRLRLLSCLEEEINDELINFSPLARLPLLVSLQVASVALDSMHMQQIKTIPSLEWFAASRVWSDMDLKNLCEPPHRLDRLKQLVCRSTRLTVSHMQHLLHLPALKTLSPLSMNIDALGWLPRIPRLAVLRVRLAGPERPATSVFLPTLQQCARLAKVELVHCTLSDEEMRKLLVALPLLWSLTLRDVSPLPNLRCLAVSSPSLQFLALKQCAGIRSLQLVHLMNAPDSRIQHLDLDLLAEDVALARQMFQPPSIHLPQLKSITVCSL